MFDVWRHPQRMWIMNLVWPITALFGTVLWLWFYFRIGRLGSQNLGSQNLGSQNLGSENLGSQDAVRAPASNGGDGSRRSKPFAAMVAEAASHCGSGCTLGDICAEWLAFAFPWLAVALGWQSIFPEKLFAVWVLDFIFAFGFGIVFQYFTIVPMRDLGVAEGIWAAIKADTLSLSAWQIGMYGFMAVAYFWIFRGLLGAELKVNSAEFWFAMQIAMIFGFLTSYPVNWWLLKAEIKEKM